MPDQTIYQQPRRMGRAGETVVTSTCGHNCGGRCVVNAHVVDDRIVKISTDPARWQPELPPLHACARGVGQIERIYHPDRLKYPMRRVGPRGSGQFERISWDEALDHVAAELLRIRETYGNAAILDCLALGQHLDAARLRRPQALLLQVRRLHRAVVEHVGRGRDLCRAHDLRRQGRLQVGRPRAHRLRELQADPDVGLEPRRRHVRHRHAAVSQGSEEEGRPHRLRRPPPHAHQRQRWPTSISSSSPRPTPRR